MNKKIDNFDEWLKKRLSEPVDYKYYDPNGNSSRAVMTRGLRNEIVYQFSRYPKELKYQIKSFKGFDTPIGYFISLFLMIVLAPFIPIIWGIFSRKNAIKEYKSIFNKEVKKQQKEELSDD